MKKRTLLGAAFSAVLASTLWPVATTAQEVTLKLHQFLPAPATVPKLILKPWAERVEEAPRCLAWHGLAWHGLA